MVPFQKQLLNELAAAAQTSSITTTAEGNEVSDAIQRGLAQIIGQPGVLHRDLRDGAG
jgi:hypothetical protein